MPTTYLFQENITISRPYNLSRNVKNVIKNAEFYMQWTKFLLAHPSTLLPNGGKAGCHERTSPELKNSNLMLYILDLEYILEQFHILLYVTIFYRIFVWVI